MAIEVAEKKDSLENVANDIISQLRKEFPNAEYLINGEVYGAPTAIIKLGSLTLKPTINFIRFSSFWQQKLGK